MMNLGGSHQSSRTYTPRNPSGSHTRLPPLVDTPNAPAPRSPAAPPSPTNDTPPRVYHRSGRRYSVDSSLLAFAGQRRGRNLGSTASTDTSVSEGDPNKIGPNLNSSISKSSFDDDWSPGAPPREPRHQRAPRRVSRTLSADGDAKRVIFDPKIASRVNARLAELSQQSSSPNLENKASLSPMSREGNDQLRFLKNFMTHFQSPSVLTDDANTIIFANPSFCGMFGHTEGEVWNLKLPTVLGWSEDTVMNTNHKLRMTKLFIGKVSCHRKMGQAVECQLLAVAHDAHSYRIYTMKDTINDKLSRHLSMKRMDSGNNLDQLLMQVEIPAAAPFPILCIKDEKVMWYNQYAKDLLLFNVDVDSSAASIPVSMISLLSHPARLPFSVRDYLAQFPGGLETDAQCVVYCHDRSNEALVKSGLHCFSSQGMYVCVVFPLPPDDGEDELRAGLQAVAKRTESGESKQMISQGNLMSALDVSTAWMADLIEHMPVGAFVFDSDLQLLFVNDVCTKWMKAPRNFWKGLNVNDVILTMGTEELAGILRQSTLGNPWTGHVRMSRSGGISITSQSLSVHRTGDGTYVAFHSDPEPEETSRADRLLAGLFPSEVVEPLLNGIIPPPTKKTGVAILFSDLVNFTPMTNLLTPNQFLVVLNTISYRVDDLAAKHGVYKIKTIGDNFMIASGLVASPEGALERMVEFALGMTKILDNIDSEFDFELPPSVDLKFRIGIEFGDVIAGIMGKTRPTFDVWGDTVNVASRMESNGSAKQVHVTEKVQQLLKDKYEFLGRGPMHIKGKGLMNTFFLVGRNEASGMSLGQMGRAASQDYLNAGHDQLKILDAWVCDMMQVGEKKDLRAAILNILDKTGLQSRYEMSTIAMKVFFDQVAKGHHDVPYHNIRQACSRTQAMLVLLDSCKTGGLEVKPLDQLALIVASLCHLLDHNGLSNDFHIAGPTEKAIRFNDVSPNESGAASSTSEIVTTVSVSLFSTLSREDKKEFRKKLLRLILITDERDLFTPWPEDHKPSEDEKIELLMRCAARSWMFRPFKQGYRHMAALKEERRAQLTAEVEYGSFPLSTENPTTLSMKDYVLRAIKGEGAALAAAMARVCTGQAQLVNHMKQIQLRWEALGDGDPMCALETAPSKYVFQPEQKKTE